MRAPRPARSRARRGSGGSRPAPTPAGAAAPRRSGGPAPRRAPRPWPAARAGEARAQLALDIGRALEIGRDACQLGLGALAAALELAQAGRLLDEAAALLGPRQQHLIDGALGDDAVQLAPEAGLGQQVAHVEAAHGLAVEQVVALAGAIEAAHHRELVARHADAAVAVVEQQLDLADTARRVLLGAREEHVLAGLRTQLAGRLRGHGPLQRVGDVGLARAVRADDDGDAAVEAQLERLAERLEAAQADGAQVHSRPSLSMRSSASWAAACSEAFFDGPSPLPMISSPSSGSGGEAAAVRWSGCFHQPVAYGRPLTCQAFLQFRLVIDEALLAVFDALVEGLDDRFGRRRGSRGAGRPRRSPTRTEQPARCGSPRCASPLRGARRSRSNSAARSSVRATSAQELRETT